DRRGLLGTRRRHAAVAPVRGCAARRGNPHRARRGAPGHPTGGDEAPAGAGGSRARRGRQGRPRDALPADARAARRRDRLDGRGGRRVGRPPLGTAAERRPPRRTYV
ncbi:MAG: Transcriptional regulator, ArsR family, partial [uncultured Solirubrobacteraceae bacterium]